MSAVTNRNGMCGLCAALWWVPLRRDVKKMNSFHQRCISTVLGITKQRQWEEHITSTKVREQWGDIETIKTKLVRRHMEWLRHLTRMPDHCLPKICLLNYPKCVHVEALEENLEGGWNEWLSTVRPKIEVSGWQSRARAWLRTSNKGNNKVRIREECDVHKCESCFRRESDQAHHKWKRSQ